MATIILNFVSSNRCANFFVISVLMEIHNHSGLNELEIFILHGIIIICCWSIWRSRNEFRFANKPVQVENIISEIKMVGFLWVRSRELSSRENKINVRNVRSERKSQKSGDIILVIITNFKITLVE
ncbi:hypothetical protein Hanom_Chr17g01563941 [Helianthus anomalus]